jgi:hypothetical protein
MSASRTIIKHLTRTTEAVNFILREQGIKPIQVPEMTTLDDYDNFSQELSSAIRFPHLMYLKNNRHLAKYQSQGQDST